MGTIETRGPALGMSRHLERPDAIGAGSDRRE